MVTKNNHWPVRPIGDIGQVLGGRQRSHRMTAGSPRPYLRVANVFDGYIDYSDVLEMPFTDDEFQNLLFSPVIFFSMKGKVSNWWGVMRDLTDHRISLHSKTR